MDTKVRINIGCGQTPTTGWRNFDNSLSLRLAKIPLLPKLLYKGKLLEGSQYQFIQFAKSNQIEYGDATKGLPISSGSVDVLYGSHMFEHLDKTEAKLFLKEARRVLRSGGIIRLSVPDLRRQVQKYVEFGDADTFIASTHLCQSNPRTILQRLRILIVGTRHHKWMYDGPSIVRLLSSMGFKEPCVLSAGTTMIPSPGELDLFEREDESVYLEAFNP
jgi:predicted SAM-dependent methyltransferase